MVIDDCMTDVRISVRPSYVDGRSHNLNELPLFFQEVGCWMRANQELFEAMLRNAFSCENLTCSSLKGTYSSVFRLDSISAPVEERKLRLSRLKISCKFM